MTGDRITVPGGPSRRRSWARAWTSPGAALVSLLALAATLALSVPLIRWAIVDATWTGAARDCRAPGAGACWAFVGAKLRFIVFGLYPPGQQWRALMATGILVSLAAASAWPRCWRSWLVGAWVVGLAVGIWLMGGGLGLPPIPTRQWGGLPITLALTAIGLGLGLPLGILLALGRRSTRPGPRIAAGVVVETVRGVPLIAVLYVAALVFPLALPTGIEVDKLALAQIAVAIFAAAYLGEAIRSGLQIIPAPQRDAALALGLSPWRAARLVTLPQALRVVLPSLISIAVGFFQDTSLVVVIGLFDLLNTARLAAQDPAWLGFATEAYVFVGLVYFLGSSSITRYGRWLERTLRT